MVADPDLLSKLAGFKANGVLLSSEERVGHYGPTVILNFLRGWTSGLDSTRTVAADAKRGLQILPPVHPIPVPSR